MLRESRSAEEYAIVLRACGATGLPGLFESVRACVEVDRTTEEWCSLNNVRMSALWSLGNLAAAVPNAVCLLSLLYYILVYEYSLLKIFLESELLVLKRIPTLIFRFAQWLYQFSSIILTRRNCERPPLRWFSTQYFTIHQCLRC